MGSKERSATDFQEDTVGLETLTTSDLQPHARNQEQATNFQTFPSLLTQFKAHSSPSDP